MATDPVESIRYEQHDSPFSVNLRERVRGLAHMAPSVNGPYLSAYIDWRPEGENPGFRPGIRLLENEIAARKREFKGSSQSADSFESEVNRIREFINDAIDPAVHGIFILSNDSLKVFEVVQVAMPMSTRLKVGPTPALRGLATVAEDYPPFAVLHADQRDASLYLVSRSSLQAEVTVAGNELENPRTGAWAYRRYRTRQDEHLHHFARAVAEETRKVLEREHLEMLVLSVGDVFGPALNEELHHTVKERVIGRINVPDYAPEHEIVEAAQDVARRAERKREEQEIERFENALGSGHNAASGPADVVRALSNGQVETLLMARDFREAGWADYQLGLYGAGPAPDIHPTGGNAGDIVQIDIGEEMVRLALATGAEVEIIPASNAGKLERHGGVGALLRY